MENVLEDLYVKVFQFVTGKSEPPKGLLVKKHSENFHSHGDISFPNTVNSWLPFLVTERNVDDKQRNLFHAIGKDGTELVEESKKWPLKVNGAKEAKERVYLFLSRPESISLGLTQGIKNINYILRKIDSKFIILECDFCEKESLTFLRMKYFCEAVKNLYAINCDDYRHKIFISAKSSSSCPEDHRRLLIGTVLNAKTGNKECAFSADDYIRIRQNEMTLIAQHKYGVRVTTDTKWKDFISHLGESAVAFELLQTKSSSAVEINFDSSMAGSSKGASFILYNCARLETILRTFSEKVEDGIYPPLPDIERTDLSLLTQEEEWNLIFNFIMGLPSVIASAAVIDDKVCEFRPHYICNYLCSMVKVVSQYYRKVRVLTESRKHLLPVMFARIHMLKILNDTLKTCLKILNIKSVSQM